MREADWFPDAMQPEPRSAMQDPAPYPYIVDVQEQSGLLWILLSIADPDWRTQVQEGAPGDHFRVLDSQGYLDTRIEVIDLARATVLASVRVPQYVRQFVAPGMVGTTIEDEDGYPFMHTWLVRLIRP
ncbi:MAG TPA: hypothetical protein VFG84_04520 [Gemmatimonadaceae bacterium]|nr:hypothetical protein [Gemmatimonadaceae bacterium]